MSTKAQQRGFTLVEVLVALVIFGVIAASVMKTLQGSVNQQAVMEERLAASWVAQQALAQLRVQEPWPPIGEKTERFEGLGGEWEVFGKVEKTNDEQLRKIVIRVRRPDAEFHSYSLEAWAGQE